MASKGGNLMFYLIGGGILLLLITSSANAAASMVSDSQLSQIASYEVFRANAYPDGSTNGVQNYSIGYGHQIQPGESSLLTATITQAQAMDLLVADLGTVTSAIASSGISLTQGQFDALTDFGFNAGIDALSKVLSTLSSSGSDAAIAEIEQYIYWHPVPGGPAVINPGLQTRRALEVQTFNS